MRTVFKLPSRGIFTALFCCLALITIGGCGNSPRVQGTITYENGELLKEGLVVFESSTGTFFGDVRSNGTYSMGSTRNGQGIPPGEYKVYFQSAQEEIGRDEDNRPLYKDLLDSKFYSPNSSGLNCTVKGNTRFDIPVTRPGK